MASKLEAQSESRRQKYKLKTWELGGRGVGHIKCKYPFNTLPEDIIIFHD
jgi:hypothetical protein